MALENLARDIVAKAEVAAKARTDEANAEAEMIIEAARSEASQRMDQARTKAQREAEFVKREVVASARQASQKGRLHLRKEQLDAALDGIRESLADPKMKGRKALLTRLIEEAKAISSKGATLLPVAVDKGTIQSIASTMDIGDEVDGLGGFMLVSSDGTITYDFRFDSLLKSTWSAELVKVNEILFG